MYVADTHSLIWYMTEDRRLGNDAKRTFEKADKGEAIMVIPTIVLMEALFITRKHKVELKFKKVLEKIHDSWNYLIYPLDFAIVLKSQELETISDMHDRVIVATAKLLNAKVITKDSDIIGSKEIENIW